MRQTIHSVVTRKYLDAFNVAFSSSLSHPFPPDPATLPNKCPRTDWNGGFSVTKKSSWALTICASVPAGKTRWSALQRNPFSFVRQLMRWGDHYSVFPDYGMEHNFTSLLPLLPPPSPPLTFPDEAPRQDQINLLLTE